MRKTPAIIVVLASMLFPSICAAKGTAQATIAISVYLAPANPTTLNIVSAADTACNGVTVSSGAGTHKCQGQAAVYTWQHSSSGTTLVVAPI